MRWPRERGGLVNTPIRRLAFVLLVVLGLLVLNLTYLQVVAGPRYRDDLRNPRVAAARSATERGPIVTREGVVVAESVPDPSSTLDFIRSYPEGRPSCPCSRLLHSSLRGHRDWRKSSAGS